MGGRKSYPHLDPPQQVTCVGATKSTGASLGHCLELKPIASRKLQTETCLSSKDVRIKPCIGYVLGLRDNE